VPFVWCISVPDTLPFCSRKLEVLSTLTSLATRLDIYYAKETSDDSLRRVFMGQKATVKMSKNPIRGNPPNH